LKVAVVGAGIFGVTGALALARRGHAVTLLDAGPIPHPLAESTDVSKAVRMDYGADELYTAEMERALDGWRRWNAELGGTVFHETGAMFVTREPMASGGFERESFEFLRARGHALERLDGPAIAARSPLRGFVDGYFNPHDGWADSGLVVERLVARARAEGVDVRENAKSVAVGSDAVTFESGQRVACDAVVVAAGGWTADLVPELRSCFRTTGQPVFHVEDRASPPSVFGADLAKTGWYGFPARDGFVKVANHGAGRAMHPGSDERVVTNTEQDRLRDFLRSHLPALAERPILRTRICVYCDTRDGDFWIAPQPENPRLVVATGGSGHAFKFAPRIGDWIADALEGTVVPRFRWRPEIEQGRSDAARGAQ